MNPADIIEVTERDVACDGGKGPLGHPRVYLHLDEHEDRIVCPYCSRLYLLKKGHDEAA